MRTPATLHDEFYPCATSVTTYCVVTSPIGRIRISSDGEAITGVYLESKFEPRNIDGWRHDGSLAPLREAAMQLVEYFRGTRHLFSLPVDLQGTPFQKGVWKALTAIPFGETRTYGQLAQQIGNPAASRAVGSANRRNPISIIVPCHRVIGTDGSLTGYAGGLSRKEWLLRHEGYPGQRSLGIRFGRFSPR